MLQITFYIFIFIHHYSPLFTIAEMVNKDGYIKVICSIKNNFIGSKWNPVVQKFFSHP